MLGQLEERQGRTEAARQVSSLFSLLDCFPVHHFALNVARLFVGEALQLLGKAGRTQGSCVLAWCVQRQCGRCYATRHVVCSVLEFPAELSCCLEWRSLLGRQGCVRGTLHHMATEYALGSGEQSLHV